MGIFANLIIIIKKNENKNRTKKKNSDKICIFFNIAMACQLNPKISWLYNYSNATMYLLFQFSQRLTFCTSSFNLFRCETESLNGEWK